MGKFTRREFLSIAVNSSALAAAQIGSKKINKLIPYVVEPPKFQPGKWLFYNTTCRECPAGCGMYLRHQNGRVVKAEGNPKHPINHGGLCPRGQSCVQGLYDPDRLTKIIHKDNGKIENLQWPDAISKIADILKSSKGRLLLVSNIQTGTMDELMRQFIQKFNAESKLVYWEPFNYESQRFAYNELFGIDGIPRYNLEQNDLIVSFGADFLEGWISNVQWAYQFSQMRHKNYTGKMVYIGPRFSMTASNADDFIPADEDALINVAAEMLRVIIKNGWAKTKNNYIEKLIESIPQSNIDIKKIERLANNFIERKSIALAGPTGSSGQRAKYLAIIAALLNYTAGNFENTIDFSQMHALSKCANREEMLNEFSSLTNDDIVIFHNCNPAYNLKGSSELFSKARNIIYIGNMPDETSRFANWVLPSDYYLESWGDYEPWSGMYGLIQPTMKRIHNTLSSGDILISLAKSMGAQIVFNEQPVNNLYEMVQSKLKQISGDSSEDIFINGYKETKPETKKVALQEKEINFNFQNIKESKPKLWLWPSVLFYDGVVANRGWMQENTEPISQMVWGNCAEINPETAKEMNLKNNDVILLKNSNGQVKVPVRITEDICKGIIGLNFGQGHTNLGKIANSRGANAFELLTKNDGFFGDVQIIKTGESKKMVMLAPTRNQYGREIVQWQQAEKLESQSAKIDEIVMPLPAGYLKKRDVYPPHDNKNHRWAMVIDLDRCIGCQSCAVACYAENNIAVMGSEPLSEGREMAWLKVVPYEHPENKEIVGFLPLPCQHCDAAPCEPVCPVFASVHNDEGLNAQIYNRCIGTRYCSNNCPYKVRRFNWRNVKWEEPLHLQLNPEVDVRCRGVMEKCTFCIQRIHSAEIEAKIKGKKIEDGTIQPACVQSCPTRVFTFGDLMDKSSEVSKIINNHPRRYQVLKELNTKPAVIYLKKIKLKDA
jgi:molybdopterin-containing oxidoreductase family iron-sulfur binding subunit